MSLSKYKKLLTVASLISISCFWVWQYQLAPILTATADSNRLDNHSAHRTAPGNTVTQESFFDALFESIEECEPGQVVLQNYKEGNRAISKAWDDKYPLNTAEELSQFLVVDKEEFQVLKASHNCMVGKLLPLSRSIFKGRGYVLTADSRYFPIAMLTIRMLRRADDHTPVEVIIPWQKSYEADMCAVLETLNAKCIVLENVIGSRWLKTFDIHGYQLKVVSILASSFQEIIMLDSDSIPLMDADTLFEHSSYANTGMVVWPDFWYRTTSPDFYKIAGVVLGERVRNDLNEIDPKLTPLADRAGAVPDKTSESGQIMMDKQRHFDTLLLATYYNLYGYRAYYPLLSQGSIGEGDKETYIAAAVVLGKPHYQVKTDCAAAGFVGDSGFHGTTIVQSHPERDLNTTFKYPAFLHVNFPKMNIREVFRDNAQYFKDTNRKRFLGDPKTHHAYRDVEAEMWTEVVWQVCEMALRRNVVATDWRGENTTEMCDRSKKHLSWLIMD